MKAGMIGLGAMGAAMAANVAKAGLLGAVWNRTADKAELLAERLGVTRAASVRELAGTVDVLLLCVSADEDVLEVVAQIARGIRPGGMVVDMSTVSSDTAVEAAAILAARQAAFLDAPVSGGVEGARNGTLAMMVGGDVEVLEKVRPVLEAMSQRIVHIGPVGSGQGVKAVNQVLAAGINQAVTEALAFAQAQNLPMGKVIDVLSAGAAGNWFLEHRGATMTRGSFQPGFKLALHNKDLRICRAMAEKNGAATTLLDMTLADYQDLIAESFGDEDISALFRKKRMD